MKKLLVTTVALAFMLTVSAPLVSAEVMDRSVKKLADGTAEVIKSPLALVEKPMDGYKDHEYPLIGFTKGLLKGPFHTVKRAGHGVVDIATFPIK